MINRMKTNSAEKGKEQDFTGNYYFNNQYDNIEKDIENNNNINKSNFNKIEKNLTTSVDCMNETGFIIAKNSKKSVFSSVSKKDERCKSEDIINSNSNNSKNSVCSNNPINSKNTVSNSKRPRLNIPGLYLEDYIEQQSEQKNLVKNQCQNSSDNRQSKNRNNTNIPIINIQNNVNSNTNVKSSCSYKLDSTINSED